MIINHFFKIKKGFYIDVGCYHPYQNNNTRLFYEKGWSGINIDLDYHSIDFFNFVRARDENINVAVSDSETEKNLYFFHNRSAINSLDSKKKKRKEIRKIQTKTLDSIIENSKFKNQKINFLSIDVEGHEYEVIKSINLKKYTPEIILIEHIDKKLENVEFFNQNINDIINSNIYKHMTENDYHFINWLHQDLIFAHSSIREK